jgi:3-isopropylmalate dehydratase small subunit
LLPVQVSEDFLKKIFDAVAKDPKTELEVNLEQQTIKIVESSKVLFRKDLGEPLRSMHTKGPAY